MSTETKTVYRRPNFVECSDCGNPLMCAAVIKNPGTYLLYCTVIKCTEHFKVYTYIDPGRSVKYEPVITEEWAERRRKADGH